MAYLERSAEATASPFIGNAPEPELTASNTGTWKARVFEDYQSLETVWRRMETEGHCTIFQTYDWVSCWYESAALCQEAEPLVVVVSREDSGPIWILPLCRYTENGRRVISFADRGVTDYTAPLISKDAPMDRTAMESMIRAVFKALPPCDIVSFEKIRKQVDGVPNPLALLHGLQVFPVGCHGIHLTEPWPALAEKIMQRRLRGTIRREKKKLGKQGEITIETREASETLKPLMNGLLEMRRERFLSIGRPDMPDMWKIFYRNLATRKIKSFNAGITTLALSGEPIAACFGLTRGKTFLALIPTFKIGQWERYRPGQQLFDTMLKDFAEKTDYDGYFDFTVGDEVYKKRFGCDREPLYEWMAPRSAAGLTNYAAWRAKTWLRKHPQLLEYAKNIRDKLKPPA